MMVRKQVYIAPEQEAKLKRLARATGRSEADIIREALEALPESTDPVLVALSSQGLIEAPTVSLSQAQAESAYKRYLQQIGSRRLGLSQTVLEERQSQG